MKRILPLKRLRWIRASPRNYIGPEFRSQRPSVKGRPRPRCAIRLRWRRGWSLSGNGKPVYPRWALAGDTVTGLIVIATVYSVFFRPSILRGKMSEGELKLVGTGFGGHSYRSRRLVVRTPLANPRLHPKRIFTVIIPHPLGGVPVRGSSRKVRSTFRIPWPLNDGFGTGRLIWDLWSDLWSAPTVSALLRNKNRKNASSLGGLRVSMWGMGCKF